MKVLLLIDSLGSGGAQRQLSLLARELRRRGWTVEMLVYHPELNHFGPMLAEADVTVVRLRKTRRFSLRTPLEVAWHALHSGAGVMLAFLGTPTAYAALARATGSAPLVVSERIGFGPQGPTMSEWLLAQMQRLADAVVCNSHHHREQFAHAFPWLGPKTLTIYNGAELRPPSDVRGHRPHDLLAIGTVTPRKNFGVVIEALAMLRSRGAVVPKVRWAGKLGHTATDQLAREAADQRLRELKLEENWEWLGERRDVPQLLAGCDALIHPSVLEGFPNAIGEAMAAGRPVLTGKVGDHGRLVDEGVNGFLFDPQEPESVADALQRLQSQSEPALIAMGRAARATAERELSVGRMAGRYAGLLQQVSGGPVL